MVYLDYAATCPVVKYPQQLYRDVLGEGYFLNPNANYAYKEKKLLKQAENKVKKAIGAKGGKVVFGGTSSQLIENLMTAALDENNLYCISSNYEHDSVDRFSDVRVCDQQRLEQELRGMEIRGHNFTPFVFWLGVSNITGEIFPVKDIGHLCHKYNAFYICDATALLGHTPIESSIDDWCDFLILDGHKAGTELGIGCCWVSDRLDKWLNGFKLHGTPNLAGALAMTQTVEDACNKDTIAKRNEHWFYLFKGLGLSLLDNGIRWAGVDRREWETGMWAINAIRLPGFNARALQSYLASKEVYIGLGQSSCATEADRRILCQGYGLSEQEADEVIRISFSEDSNTEDVKVLVENICEFKKIYLDN